MRGVTFAEWCDRYPITFMFQLSENIVGDREQVTGDRAKILLWSEFFTIS
ncbi:hypothetical protein [Sphaerospermopsis torques-reginae]|uniref:Uncharacterized protein n=1 Tax=Sphaerospermopsis torques-reginae ITEP-024 TaxID=984208 RepID=A0ABX8X3U7_9CYAN|nr:hypothetical protein [Sphaerospermopsis torques-reginae]QYX33343.1 hypothetical protein K2F26_08510 [Sphaerospermopsis torques-reginae ITEP-024]